MSLKPQVLEDNILQLRHKKVGCRIRGISEGQINKAIAVNMDPLLKMILFAKFDFTSWSSRNQLVRIVSCQKLLSQWDFVRMEMEILSQNTLKQWLHYVNAIIADNPVTNDEKPK